MISLTSSIFINFKKSLIPKSSGLIPSIGDNLPSKTKYLPLNPPVDSIAKTSEGFSTTQMLFISLALSEQILQRLFDVSILHLEHLPISSIALSKVLANIPAPSLFLSSK